MSSLPPPPPGYPQYGAPPPGRIKVRGRIPLRLALILGVVGVALCVVGIVVVARSPIANVGDLPRAALDGTPHAVQLTRTGDYVGYYETPGASPLRSQPGRLRITGPSGEVPIATYSPNTTMRYDDGSRHGVAVVTFSIARPGRYTVAGEVPGAPPGATIALGRSIVGGLVAGVLCFVFGLLLVIAAVVLLIVGLVKRSRHKRELASAYVGGGGPNYFTGR